MPRNGVATYMLTVAMWMGWAADTAAKLWAPARAKWDTLPTETAAAIVGDEKEETRVGEACCRARFSQVLMAMTFRRIAPVEVQVAV